MTGSLVLAKLRDFWTLIERELSTPGTLSVEIFGTATFSFFFSWACLAS